MQVDDGDGGITPGDVTVTVNRTEASFTLTPRNGEEGVPVRFDATGSIPALGDLTYSWDFGDGNVAAFDSGDHIYADNDAYEVRLVVTDDAGGRHRGPDSNHHINNLPPVITSVNANPLEINEGEPSTITVTAVDVARPTLPTLEYRFDCNNDQVFEVCRSVTTRPSVLFRRIGYIRSMSRWRIRTSGPTLTP